MSMQIDKQNSKKRKKEKICGIYCISNSKYFYIGHSVNIFSRWTKHRNLLRNNKHINPILQNVYNKYNEYDPFKYEIIKECQISDLQRFEGDYVLEYIYKFPDKKCMNIANPIKAIEHFIRKDGKLVNINKELADPLMYEDIKTTKIGRAPWKFVKVVQLDKSGNLIKIWDSKRLAEEELNISIHMKKHSCGGYQWQKYDEWLENPKGKIQHKYNIDDTVKQYSFSGELLHEWPSIKEASKCTNISASTIVSSCNSENKTAGGFIWKHGDFIPIKNPTAHLKKKVNQYKNGILINSYDSIRSAAQSINSNATTLKKYISNNKELGGFIWKYQK